MEASVSPIAQRIADAVAPTLVAAATQHKEQIIHAIGHGIIERNTVRIEYPLILRGIPPGVAYGVDALLTYFAGRPPGEIINAVIDHAKVKGITLGEDVKAGFIDIQEQDML